MTTQPTTHRHVIGKEHQAHSSHDAELTSFQRVERGPLIAFGNVSNAVDRQSYPDVAHPAVVRLAEGTAVLRRVTADRPVLVAEALLDGVMPQQVAEATGLDLDELRAAVGRWATRLKQEGRLTDPAYTNLVNAVFGPATW